MHAQQDHGIILRVFPFSETSLIVHWSTAQHGMVRTLAKGARQAKSRSFPKLDLFLEAELTFTHSRTSHLHALREAHITQEHTALRKDFSKTCAAAYFVELLSHALEPDSPGAGIHILLSKALAHLETHAPTLRLVERYEMRLACELGIADESTPPHLVSERLKTGELKSRRLLDEQLHKNTQKAHDD